MILKATKEGNCPSPILLDGFNPDMTTLTIFINKNSFQETITGIDTEKLGIGTEELGIGAEKLGIDTEKLGIDTEKFGFGTEELGIGAEKLGIDNKSIENNINLIYELNTKSDAKNSLKCFYRCFRNKIFGNKDMQHALKISKNTATYYIKLLKQYHIIESVKGFGKGKYKFKRS